MPSVSKFEFIPDLFQIPVTQCDNEGITLTTCDAINAACLQISTSSESFVEQGNIAKNCNSYEDDSKIDGGRIVREGGRIKHHRAHDNSVNSGCVNNNNKNQNLEKISLANCKPNIEKISDVLDEHNACLTMQSNEARGSKFKLPTPTQTVVAPRTTERFATTSSFEELVTNNTEQQTMTLVGSLKVRDEFLELKQRSNTNIYPNVAANDTQIREDSPHRKQQLHFTCTKELNKEDGDAGIKNSKYRSRRSSKISNDSGKSNNSNDSKVGGGVAKQTHFLSDSGKHLENEEEDENTNFQNIKGKSVTLIFHLILFKIKSPNLYLH